MTEFGCFVLSNSSSALPEINDEGLFPDALVVNGTPVSLSDDEIPLAMAEYLATRPEFQKGIHLVIFMEGGVTREDFVYLQNALPRWELTFDHEFTANKDEPAYHTLGKVSESDSFNILVVKAAKKPEPPMPVSTGEDIDLDAMQKAIIDNALRA